MPDSHILPSIASSMPQTTPIAIAPLQKPAPFLKWAGGKRVVLEQYKEFFPTAYHTFREPFLGGGAVFFHLEPEMAVLSDINPHVTNAYTQIRDNVEAIIAGLELSKREHCKDFYKQVRDNFPEDASPFQQAIRFLYLNKTCFNGLYRENSKGRFNVPMGSYRNPKICDRENLLACSAALQGIDIRCQGFDAIVDQVEAGDFVYFDPPYHDTFAKYTRFDFSGSDQERLAISFKEVVSKGAYALLSNSDTPLIRELYKDFQIVQIIEPQFISAKGSGRGKKPCVLVVGGNYA